MKDFCEMVFGTASGEEIARQKATGKQIRAIAGGKDNIAIQLTADECKKLCKAANGLEYLSGYENRIRQYTVTDETVDRYGDIVRAKGMKLDNYKKNPVVQFAHDYSMPPVGFSIKTWYDSITATIKALAMFLDDRVDSTGRSDLIFRFVNTNGMRACSIGFDPMEMNNPASAEERKKLGLGQFGIEYLTSDMLEFSPVPLPANPNALSEAYRRSFDDNLTKTLRSGLFTAKDVGVLKAYPLFQETVLDAFIRELGTKSVIKQEPPEPDDNDDEEGTLISEEDMAKPFPNEHAARIREPEDFEPDSFRRKEIEEGIDLIVGKIKGETTMTTQSYRFKKDIFTAEEAEKWLKDHDVAYISFEPASEEKAASTGVIVNLNIDMGAVLTAFSHMTEETKKMNETMAASKQSFEDATQNFLATAQKALSAIEANGRKSSLYDNPDRLEGILKL